MPLPSPLARLSFVLCLVPANSALLACGTDQGAQDSTPGASSTGTNTDEGPTSAESPTQTAGTETDADTETDAAETGDEPAEPCAPTTRELTHFVTPEATAGAAGSMADPWSLADAMLYATAGDVVEIAPGMYSTAHADSRYLPAFRPEGSGSADAPIVFVARHAAATCEDPALRSEIRTDATTNTGESGSPAFGAFDRDYIVFDGLYADEAFAHLPQDAGLASLWESNGSQIVGSRLIAEVVMWPNRNNHSLIRVEQSLDLTLRANVLTGVGQGEDPNTNDAAGIVGYNVDGAEIANNLVESCSIGIYPKGDQADDPMRLADWRIHHNIVRSCKKGIFIGGVNSGVDAWVDIHNNVVHDVSNFLWFIAYDVTTPRNVRVVNNTFHSATSVEGSLYFNGDLSLFEGEYASFENIVLRNNILLDASSGFGGYLPEQAFDRVDPDYNVLFALDVSFPYDRDLATWQGMGKDINSLFEDPALADVAAGDYSPTQGSPCLDAGIDILELQGLGPDAAIDIGAVVSGDPQRIGPG